MFVETYLHHNPQDTIPTSVMDDVSNCLNQIKQAECQITQKYRARILHGLSKSGWSKNVRVSVESRISITGKLGSIGLCVQTGNMGRFYADLLKLQAMFNHNDLSAAIYIVPRMHFAKRMNQNLANYERLTKELLIFDSVITVPIVVFGVGG